MHGSDNPEKGVRDLHLCHVESRPKQLWLPQLNVWSADPPIGSLFSPSCLSQPHIKKDSRDRAVRV